MRWFVEITDVEGNDRLLRDILGQLSITVVEEQAGRFLVSESFEALPTPGEVHDLAMRIRSILEETGSADPQIQLKLKIGTVFEEAGGDARRKHAFLTISPAHFRITGSTMSVKFESSVSLSEDQRKRLEEEQREREYQQLRRKALSRVVSAFRDDRALQVQRLLCAELTPQTMGHIADLIQDDIGGEMKDLISGAQLTRFYRSINHPDVFGAQARHIVSNVEPPSRPMSLGEAREFIRALATRWMDTKAGLDGAA